MLILKRISLIGWLSSIVLLTSLSATELLSQHQDFNPKLWMGLRGGAHLSRYQFVPSVSQRQYRGRGAGLLFRLDLERGASVQLELNYVETGWKERFDDNRKSIRHLTYLELPVLSHLYLSKGAWRVFVNAGPFLGYNVGDRHCALGEGFDTSQLFRQTTPLKYKVAWGLVGGVGLSYAFGARQRLELDGRVGYNFQDVWGNRRIDPYGQSTELRIALALSYCFSL